MQEKIKKYFLSLAVRSAVAVVLFVMIFFTCKIFPQALKPMKPVWTNSMDIRKIGSLLYSALKETLP